MHTIWLILGLQFIFLSRKEEKNLENITIHYNTYIREVKKKKKKKTFGWT